MKSFKSLSALIVVAFGMVSTLQAQKKLANDIYTYNYAGIINGTLLFVIGWMDLVIGLTNQSEYSMTNLIRVFTW